jgi:hypothetical protein
MVSGSNKKMLPDRSNRAFAKYGPDGTLDVSRKSDQNGLNPDTHESQTIPNLELLFVQFDEPIQDRLFQEIQGTPLPNTSQAMRSERPVRADDV